MLRGRILSTTPPPTSIPSDSGSTSRSSTSSFGPSPGEQVGLHRRPERDDLIGIDVGERLASEELRHVGAHGGNPRRPADEDDPVELLGP